MNSIQKYFLGVDAGGTKTHALISDQDGQVLGFGKSGPGNWEMIGLNGLIATLQEAVSQALKSAGLKKEQISGAGYGLAGYDWPSQRSMLLGALKPLGLDCPLEIVNDAELGIFAGTSQGWGISVVSGTGCNCRGMSKDRARQGRMVGGCPDWSGEYAGGYDILNRALRAVTFEWNKRGPATGLSQAFLLRTGAKDLGELIEGFYIQKYSFEPRDVMLVFESAERGDPEALNVVRWAGEQLGQMACGVIRQLNFEQERVEVVLIGSLFDGHPLMTESLQKTILELASQAELLRLKAPPVVGGVLLGMEQVLGMAAYTCHESLISSSENILRKK